MSLPSWMNRRLVMGILAVALGSAAAMLAQRYLAEQRRIIEEQERQKLMASQPTAIEVVTAARDLPEGTVLDASHLQITAVPEQFIQPYAVRSPNDVMGKTTVAPIAKDEQILSTKLRRPEEAPVGSTLSSVTPKGKRAVTISVDTMTGVGGFVRPGDVVDILWTLKLPEAGQPEGQAVTLTVFQDVPVLAVGGEMVGRAANAGPGDRESREYTVTLALTPQETSFLLFAREQGRLQLSLRPKAEEGQAVKVVPANINTLLEMQLGIKTTQQPAAVKSGRQVEVYKGLKRDVVALSESE